MTQVTIHAAKTQLSRLIERARGGEEIVILRNKEPVARLLPVQPIPKGRRPGALKGQLVVEDAFFEPLPDADLAAWEGRD